MALVQAPRLARGPDDADGIKAVRRFLLKVYHPDKRGGRGDPVTPATNRLTAAIPRASWIELNEMLQPLLSGAEPLPVGFAVPAKPSKQSGRVGREDAARQRQRGVTEEQTAELKRVNKVFQRAAASTYERAWWRLDDDMKANLLNEAIAEWYIRGPGGIPTPVQARGILRLFSKKWRDIFRREVQQGDFARDEVRAAEEPSDEEKEAEARILSREAKVSNLLDLLEASGPEGKIRTTLIRLHRGEPAFPGQPKALLGKTPLRNMRPRRAQGYHPGGGEQCPTCRAISRYVHARGMTPGAVGAVIDDFIRLVQQEIR